MARKNSGQDFLFSDDCGFINGDDGSGESYRYSDGSGYYHGADGSEGYESVNDNGITVVLDTNLSPELLEEGFVREIISKIPTMRKEADFEVMDRIKVTYEGSEKAEAVFEKNNTLIAGEVLADEVVKAQPAGYVKEWKINGEAVTMGVEKKGE